MSQKKVAVVLAGCGVQDGSEIYETTITLLHLAKKGVAYDCLAPSVDFAEVDHSTGKETGEKRNVYKESARLARGEIKPLEEANPTDYAAIFFPGGFGAAKNLSNFAAADKLEDMTCLKSVTSFVRQAYQAKMPLGFMCIAPACVAAIALKDEGLTLTIGTDKDTAAQLEGLGHTHKDCAVDDIIIDDDHNITTTPAFMLASHLGECDAGIGKLVDEVCRRAEL